MRTTVDRPSGEPSRPTRGSDGPTPASFSDLHFDEALAIRIPAVTWEQLAWIAVVVGAFTMRIWNVGARAMHHDESMHAFYSWQLFKGDGYQYNPMLHGPFQFHANALMFLLFGVSDTSARLTAVLCGTGIVIAVWFLRPYLGRLGAILTAFLFAISPSFLYFSRFTREDIYVAFFTLLMAVGMFGWLHSRKRGYIYLLFTATALAFATKESTFITLFIFGTFVAGVLIWEVLLLSRTARALRLKAELATDGGAADGASEGALSGVLDDADGRLPTGRSIAKGLLSVPGSVWLTGIVCFAVVIILLFTTFLTNRHGLVDAFTSSLGYWLQQQGVKRGNQPAFYYALLLPAYEQIPVLFGIIGMGYFVFRRWFLAVAAFALFGAQMLALAAGSRADNLILVAVTLVLGLSTLVLGLSSGNLLATFLTYWAILAFIIYSWAGEKMPWLVIHIAMPLVLLAGLFLGEFLKARRWNEWRWAVAIGGSLLVLFTIHADWPLNYYRGDVPQDMLIYTQTSPQVKDAVAQINQLSDQLTGGTNLPILLDNDSTWPFAWYLRDYKNISYVPSISSPPTQPVVITAVQNDAQDKPQMSNYVGNRYKLRAWFPEDYRDLTLPKVAQSVVDPAMRKTLWNWLTLRQPPSAMGSYDFDLWIRKDLAPGLTSNFAMLQQQQAVAAAPAAAIGPDPFQGSTVKIPSVRQFGAPGAGDGQLADPIGVAVAPDGSTYVADQANNRVQKFDASGKFVLKWGSKGAGDGQFDTPSGIAIDKAGNVWVTDLWNHRVQEFDASGKFLLKFGSYAAASGSASPGKFFGPRGIAVGPQGDVYVTDTGNKRVQEFTARGVFELTWGSGGNGPGQLEEPMGIAVDGQGNVYVADTWNRRIQKFGANGAFLSQVSVGSWPASQTTNGEPFLAVAPNGSIVTTDPLHGRILAFTAQGQLLSAWGGPGSDVSTMSFPTGVAIAPNGDVVVADTLNNRILAFPPPR